MSYNYIVAMGYGIGTSDLLNLSSFKNLSDQDSEGAYVLISEKLSSASDSAFRSKSAVDAYGSPVYGSYALCVDETDKIVHPTDLFTLVQPYDAEEGTAFLFYPNATLREVWRRYNNELDIERLVNWPSESNFDTQPNNAPFIQWPPMGFGIWRPFFMDSVTKKVGYANAASLKQNGNLRPAVPAEIRQYLTMSGIMTDEEVTDYIRPLIASFWSY